MFYSKTNMFPGMTPGLLEGGMTPAGLVHGGLTPAGLHHGGMTPGTLLTIYVTVFLTTKYHYYFPKVWQRCPYGTVTRAHY